MVPFAPAAAQTAEIDAPSVVLAKVPFNVPVVLPEGGRDGSTEALFIAAEGLRYPVRYDSAHERFQAEKVVLERAGRAEFQLFEGEQVVAQSTTRAVPGWLSIVPPLLAILVALIWKRVIPALFLGIWIGAWIVAGLSLTGLWQGLLESFQVYVLDATADPDHAAIALFSLMIGGMVGIISKNGGTHGVVNLIVGWAGTPQRGQLAAGGLGLAIFFDDYAEHTRGGQHDAARHRPAARLAGEARLHR